MWRLVLAIIAFAMAMVVIKMVIIALVVAGLVFRTKVTLALLFVGGMVSLIAAYPVIGLSVVAILVVVGIKQAKANKEVPVIEEANPE